MKRGDIWWADLGPPEGERPVLLLSRDAAYEGRRLVTVATVTTYDRAIRSQVQLGPEHGMPRVCVANLDNLVTIDKLWCSSLITQLSRAKLREVEEAIHYALGLSY